MTPEEIAAELENGPVHKTVDVGTGFGQSLATLLYKNGWSDYETRSRCKVASCEFHLQKNGRVVEIISSFFLGPFTQINAR